MSDYNAMISEVTNILEQQKSLENAMLKIVD